jgi:hypothetical protein
MIKTESQYRITRAEASRLRMNVMRHKNQERPIGVSESVWRSERDALVLLHKNLKEDLMFWDQLKQNTSGLNEDAPA